MATEKRNPRKDAAYKSFPGMSAAEAEEKGYAVVEYAVDGGGMAPIYGYYIDSWPDAALEHTVGDTGASKIVPVGGPPLAPPRPMGDKGNLVNPNDPVIHATAGADVHADGSPDPGRPDIRPQLEEGAVVAGEKNADKKTGK